MGATPPTMLGKRERKRAVTLLLCTFSVVIEIGRVEVDLLVLASVLMSASSFFIPARRAWAATSEELAGLTIDKTTDGGWKTLPLLGRGGADSSGRRALMVARGTMTRAAISFARGSQSRDDAALDVCKEAIGEDEDIETEEADWYLLAGPVSLAFL